MNDVLGFINSLEIDKNEKLIVACSGGPDSMFLLNLLKSQGYSCVCAHINHKFRKESDEEYLFVQKYCHENDIIFEGVELEGYVSGNFEFFARNFRYSFFDKIVEKYDSKYLFTAHHGDDLMETILMRLVRGSSLKGYSGFSSISKRDNYSIIRPLIYLTKDFIEEYNKEFNIPYVVDYTNDLDDYTRNRFRHNVLPFFKEEDNLAHLRFLKFSETLKESSSFLDRLITSELDKMYKSGTIDLKLFKECDKYIQKEIINYLLSGKYPDNLYLINGNHTGEILKIIDSDKPNLKLRLPDDIMVIKEYDKLKIINSISKDKDYQYPFNDYLELELGVIKKRDKVDNNSNNVIRLNSKDIKLPIIVRNRREGDKISIKNMDGSKKVNKIFIDSKVGGLKRNKWPIVCDSDNNILWIPGLKKSKFDIPINGLCDIILEYEKGEEIDE